MKRILKKANMDIIEDNSAIESLISKIIDMDAKASEMNNAIENIKTMSEKTIVERKKAMREEYMDKANRRIAKIEIEEKERAEKEIAVEMARFELAAKALDEKFEINRDKWVNEIVRRAIEI